MFPTQLGPDLIQFASQHIIVRFQRIQHIPDGFEVTCLYRVFGILSGSDEHRQDDGASFLIWTETNGATHGLDDVHLAATWINKRNAIEGRHVHAFGQAACIAQHAAFICAQGFELVEFDFAFVGGHVTGDEVGA